MPDVAQPPLFLLTRRRRLLLGLLTLVPFVVVAISAWHPTLRVFLTAQGWRTPGRAITSTQIGALFVTFTTFVLVVALVIFYFGHLTQTRRLRDDQRLPWALLLVLGSVLVMPFYWYWYVWSDRSRAHDAQQHPPGVDTHSDHE